MLSVLMVEDNPLNQELARDLLEAAGHDVSVARDGSELWLRIHDGRPDLILMDILLPGTDGMTLLHALRASSYADVPVIAVTAQALPADLERFVGAGFDAVLTKPIDTRTFVADLEKHASAHRRSTKHVDDDQNSHR